MTDGNGFTEDTNSYILMRVSLEPQRTRLNSHSRKDGFKTVSDWGPFMSRAILCEFLTSLLCKHIFWIYSQVPRKISELCFDFTFSISSCNNITVPFSGFQKWAFKTMGQLSEVSSPHKDQVFSWWHFSLERISPEYTLHGHNSFGKLSSSSCLPTPITQLSKALI